MNLWWGSLLCILKTVMSHCHCFMFYCWTMCNVHCFFLLHTILKRLFSVVCPTKKRCARNEVIFRWMEWNLLSLFSSMILWCHQIPLARSEGNLLDLMETVCERMVDYGERVDSSTNRKSYIRIKPRNGEAMDLSEATLDSRVTASLKFAVSTAALCYCWSLLLCLTVY